MRLTENVPGYLFYGMLPGIFFYLPPDFLFSWVLSFLRSAIDFEKGIGRQKQQSILHWKIKKKFDKIIN